MDLTNLLKRVTGCAALAWMLALMTGCAGTGQYAEPVLDPKTAVEANKFHIGDLVVVNFSGVTDLTIPQHEERVREEGTITLPHIGPVKAEGFTPGQLQEDIRRRYVGAGIYTANLAVTVRAPTRYFFVGGEVKASGQYEWLEGMNVQKAIQKAGYFTEYAKRSKIRVTRQGVKPFTVDYDAIIEHPERDVWVLPNDTITVPKKSW
ncbi:MAG: hypothetical protein RLY20_2585 [Verrucomicrobiota bacterium]|jgi:polysaccharide export outer membrane protein